MATNAAQAIKMAQVRVPNGSLQIQAYLVEPVEPGPYPAIVVLQEIFGVNDHIRDVTERIAKEGYVAIAPAIYQRTAPGFEVGYGEVDFKLGRQHKDQTKAEELLSDIQATIEYLKMLPSVQGNAFGTIGFCFGGHVAYLVATLPDVQVTACFYGAGITTMTPGGGVPTITRTPEIPGIVYGFFGTEDPLIPNDQTDQVEEALMSANDENRVYRYQATHGFFCDQRESYNAEAATDAWEKVKGLFARLKEE